MINYENILNVVAEKGNMGGIATHVYFAPYADFKSLASKPAESGSRDFDTMNKLNNGVDELLPGKKLFKLYSTQGKGSLIASRQGEMDGGSHRVVLSLETPGLDSKSLAMLMIPNQDWIFYIKTGSQMFRLGNDAYPAKLLPEGDVGTGDSPESKKGNQMSFGSYEVGFAGEVVDPSAIDLMLTSIDESFTATFTPLDGAKGSAVGVSPTIAFSEAVISADTGVEPIVAELSSFVTLKEVDFNGDYVGDIAFTPSIAANTITVDPDANLGLDKVYEVKFDKSKILSAAANGVLNGSNYARFGTADA